MIEPIDILAKISFSPIKSGPKLASEAAIGTSSVYRILRRFKFHPYKIRKIQKLSPPDSRQRIDFCQWGTEKVNQDDHFVEKNFFSDEVIYYLITNAILEWCESLLGRWHEFTILSAGYGVVRIRGDHIIGSFLFEGSEGIFLCYLQMLELDESPKSSEAPFQLDKASGHWDVSVRNWLDN